MTRSKDADKPRRPPATTLEARENQMIALAVDLAEKQLADGTASSQIVTHYLKLGTTREQLEKNKIQLESELLQARADEIASRAGREELYANALNAMRSYQGQEPLGGEDYDED